VSGTGSGGGLAGAAEPLLPGRDHPLTVAQLLGEARRALDRAIRTTWVIGEVDSLNLHRASGHYYFCLKDARAQIAAVMWRADAQALRFRLELGQSLLCRGHFDIYDRQGRFQFIIKHAEPAGAGADALAREQLKLRLLAEGLFDAARKRELPTVPRAIGLVTSKSGAAVRDVIRAVQRRFPVPILIADCRVQGAQAPASIVRALAMIERAAVDVVIVGRGGGGASDLGAFDDERVVRAVAACRVPTISAVGHEVDISLTDLVADHRAATPTMAGEMAVPVWSDLYEQLAVIERRMARELDHAVRGARHELAGLLDIAASAGCSPPWAIGATRWGSSVAGWPRPTRAPAWPAIGTGSPRTPPGCTPPPPRCSIAAAARSASSAAGWPPGSRTRWWSIGAGSSPASRPAWPRRSRGWSIAADAGSAR